MSDNAIDRILKDRQRGGTPAEAEEGNKFYSVLSADGLVENFLELQFRNGMRTCFNYSDLQFFTWDPEACCMDLEFGGFLITIKGRGLYPNLFQGIKNRRVAWVKEADSEMQDHDGNESFVEEITILPPKDFADGGDSDEGPGGTGSDNGPAVAAGLLATQIPT